ncbi:coiled-coil domain-containing protein 22 homolog [Anopheles gambiae]|uniref:Coiled-coil domain-containing protein 22 homolog n=1 Tax=Anopheles coluzzii TaxID=1518534 RepID=A0A6E8W3I9_ANOCL|nr:coiled-coil domain-containing protein 22 homolog [Anopheles coluzzii]XP_040231538.2 coiled-coil domain-containing protein 22 homolog [Anopheles coluzzii]XP_040231539.2 coiled-coil domain-containing protein 22 homolog [Anopheles coluzzii]XP_049465118.1 coiled-coil domain-containing protein 22 homolog [Anopheles coluzzii]XP_061515734.1 coiled-coil domain-containing protein 22 homolog [Anopheles gambiae]XP_061515735.1 coiled-coil domain-containing protein 22 homolog [Anopheles gambiae]XP_0615
MDDIDNIVLHSLRQIDCDLDEDIQGLEQFTPAVLVRTVSKCLLLIDPSLDLPQTLPPGMAQRFTVTARLAEACTAVGYRRDIGYQTFLYSNVAEVRRVFMFLIEQLPKDSTDAADPEAPLDRVTDLENRILDSMRQQLRGRKDPATPLDLRNATLGWAGSRSRANIPFVTQSDVTAEIKQYWLRRSGFWEEEKDEVDRRAPDVAASTDDSILKLQAYYAQNKAQCPLAEELEEAAETPDRLGQLDALEQEIAAIETAISESRREQRELHAKRRTVAESAQAVESVVEKLKEEKKIKERTHILLENPEVNVAKLESIIAAAGEKMKKLQSQWEAHRSPLVATLEEHQAKNSDQVSKSQKVLDQIESARHKSEEVIVDLQTKSALHARLVQEYERMGRTVSRTAYTSRILEIIGNIRKQKTDIDKILHDTRSLQKEINSITGQLDRQFTVTDDLIFRNAKRDEYCKRAYILLVALHTECSELTALVQETGTVKREVRELEDQIENEKDRNVVTNLAQIGQDLEEMQRESRRLEEAIQQLELSTGRNGTK